MSTFGAPANAPRAPNYGETIAIENINRLVGDLGTALASFSPSVAKETTSAIRQAVGAAIQKRMTE